MDVESDDAPSRERRLDEALAAFRTAQEAGGATDHKSWVESHPDLAPEFGKALGDSIQLDWWMSLNVPIRPGPVFAGYRILRSIGRGGAGRVFEARSEAEGRLVALKVLQTAAIPDPEDVERFRIDADALIRLRHPHIIPILEVGDHAGIPYFTMPLMAGSLELKRWRSCGDSAGNDSPVHLRRVARIGIQVASALAHAHAQEVLHRDIKPSNLLVDAKGDVYVSDFGAAKSGLRDGLTETGGWVGTPRYMAPEGFRSWRDPRSDVYSLGLTLYELAVGRPAFDERDLERLIVAIQTRDPVRPRRLNRYVPVALETIIGMAIEKEPAHRYQTAEDLADDLQRFLDGRPIRARRLGPIRRAWSWTRRHKARAAILAAVFLGLIGLVVETIFYLDVRARSAEAASRDSRYQILLMTIQQTRMAPHANGWRSTVEGLIGEAASIRRDGALRDQAAAMLGGIDATLARRFDDFGATSVAFDREGKRLLIGGHEPTPGQDGNARLWDLGSPHPRAFPGCAGPGPVAFRPDGIPSQLVAERPGTLRLRNLTSPGADDPTFTLPDKASPHALAMTPDGSIVAASAGGTVLVWGIGSAQPSHRFEADATALAFSPDGQYLAAGDDGRILVWSLATGERVATLRFRRNTILSLSFGRDPSRVAEGGGWLLASGDSGSSVVVWDLQSKAPQSFCHGSQYDVHALAFSPDGMTLASSGRGPARLWDVATGRPLLDLGFGDFMVGLAFSPDGRSLAGGCEPTSAPGHVSVLHLEFDRGLKTLRGLIAPIAKVAFSPDHQRLAALSHDFRVAAWDLASGKLVYVRDGPKGATADNAAIGFGPGGSLIVSAFSEVQWWEAESGRTIRSWKLPPGMVNQLAFTPSGRLLSLRSETLDGVNPPYRNDYRRHPRVVRLRNLLAPDPHRPLLELRMFNRHVLDAWLSPDGGYLVAEGFEDGRGGKHRSIRAFDSETRAPLWTRNVDNRTWGSTQIKSDPGGTVLAIVTEDANRVTLLESPRTSGTSLVHKADPLCLGPAATVWTSIIRDQPDAAPRGFSLRRGDTHLLNLSMDLPFCMTEQASTFSSDGSRLAWGHTDGTVIVGNLREIRERLEALRLGW